MNAQAKQKQPNHPDRRAVVYPPGKHRGSEQPAIGATHHPERVEPPSTKPGHTV